MKQRTLHTLAGFTAGTTLCGGVAVLETGSLWGLFPVVCSVVIAAMSVTFDP